MCNIRGEMDNISTITISTQCIAFLGMATKTLWLIGKVRILPKGFVSCPGFHKFCSNKSFLLFIEDPFRPSLETNIIPVPNVRMVLRVGSNVARDCDSSTCLFDTYGNLFALQENHQIYLNLRYCRTLVSKGF